MHTQNFKVKQQFRALKLNPPPLLGNLPGSRSPGLIGLNPHRKLVFNISVAWHVYLLVLFAKYSRMSEGCSMKKFIIYAKCLVPHFPPVLNWFSEQNATLFNMDICFLWNRTLLSKTVRNIACKVFFISGPSQHIRTKTRLQSKVLSLERLQIWAKISAGNFPPHSR